MPKFFVSPDQIQGDQIRITEDAHHISHVLRMKIGDHMIVCDGQGTDHQCIIASIDDQAVTCHIESSLQSPSEPLVHITLFQGLPKSDKMEWILQKGTELGISAFVPVEMKRSVVRIEPKKEAKKLERLRKIAEAAAKQSSRGIIPCVEESCGLEKVLARASEFDLLLVPYEGALDQPLKQRLEALPETTRKIAILIGPEGGIDPSEIERLIRAGAVPVGLGPRILRTETAGPVTAALLLYHFS
ncbi:MAG: 16S rRNA (uracil(1498)-N(3))-methyltransferase [Clostridiales bacterium]|nr:16S rRNA (uracil(1498)-N(3))-methyltransferase [Clostridiales bacterium]